MSKYHTHLKLRAFFLQLAVDSYYIAHQDPAEAASEEIVIKAKQYYFSKINTACASSLQETKQNTKLPTLVETVGKHHPRCVLQHLTQLANDLFLKHEDLYPAEQDFHSSWELAPKTRQCKQFIKLQMQMQCDTKCASTPWLDHSCENLTLAQLRTYPICPFVDETTMEILPLDLGNA